MNSINLNNINLLKKKIFNLFHLNSANINRNFSSSDNNLNLITTSYISSILPLTSSLLTRINPFTANYTVSYYSRHFDEKLLNENQQILFSKNSNLRPNLDNSHNIDGTSKYFTDSYVELCLPLKTDLKLRDVFRRPDYNSALRWGLLLELTDAISGDVAYRHCLKEGRYVESSNITIVTLSIDKMNFYNLNDIKASPSKDLKIYNNSHDLTFSNINSQSYSKSNYSNFLQIDYDMIIRAFPSYVGTSSLEVRIEIFQNSICVGSGFFVMVALNLISGNLVKLPSLLKHPEFSLLDSFFEQGKQRTFLRKKLKISNESLVLPTHSELNYLHNRYIDFHLMDNFSQLNTTVFNKNFIPINKTILKSTMLMQHDKRNVHNKIFGGYLARKAFELSWLTAQLFIKNPHPSLKAIDQIFFFKPIEIGSMIEMESKVIFTELNEIQIEVEANQIDIISLHKTKTNNFIFSYEKNQNGTNNNTINEVIPIDYSECLKFVSGLRRYLNRTKIDY